MAETIDSILMQTYEDFELIISDNASTDQTEEICRRYAEKDVRIKYVRNRENLGAAYNYNQTFHLSSGEFFKWAPHDDILRPEFLERCLDALDDDPVAVMSYTGWIPIDETGALIEKTNTKYQPWRADSLDPAERSRFIFRMEPRPPERDLRVVPIRRDAEDEAVPPDPRGGSHTDRRGFALRTVPRSARRAAPQSLASSERGEDPFISRAC